MKPPLPPLSLGQKLHAWRSKRGLTQDELGDMFRGVTGPTVGRWEKGQEIPGPVQILLEWLIDGRVPFQELTVPQSIREEALKVTMSLEAWERLDALRLAGGYATVTDMIAVWIQEELAQPVERWTEADTRTGDQASVDGLALLADVTPADVAGGGGTGDAVGVHTDAAAEVFAKQNPVPPAGAADAPLGTTAGRQNVIYKRPQGRSGTGARKR